MGLSNEVVKCIVLGIRTKVVKCVVQGLTTKVVKCIVLEGWMRLGCRESFKIWLSVGLKRLL